MSKVSHLIQKAKVARDTLKSLEEKYEGQTKDRLYYSNREHYENTINSLGTQLKKILQTPIHQIILTDGRTYMVAAEEEDIRDYLEWVGHTNCIVKKIDTGI